MPAPVREVPVEGCRARGEGAIRQDAHPPAGEVEDLDAGRIRLHQREFQAGRGPRRVGRGPPERDRGPPGAAGGASPLSWSKTIWTGGRPVASGPARQVSLPVSYTKSPGATKLLLQT